MGQRFGGKYSPQNSRQAQSQANPQRAAADMARQAAAEDRRVDGAGARANFLFVPAVLTAVACFNKGPEMFLTGIAAGVAMAFGAWLTREGMRAHAAYDARPVARRPAFPRKIFGAIFIAAGVSLAAWNWNGEVFGAILYAVIALILHLGAFGIDPLSDKRVEGIDTFQQDRVAKVVDEAEGYLGTIKDHIATLGDRQLEGRVATFLAMARRMIRTVQEDPRDLADAKKFLVVYLMGARDATVKFADLYKRSRDADARRDYESLLSDLETNFAARTTKMLEGDRSEMDIEIKVLRDRLSREGVRSDTRI